MASLFGTKKHEEAAPTPPVSSLRVQTSIDGKPRAIGWGVTRVPGNIIWYGDFYSQQVTQAAAGSPGGKGGLFSPPSQPGSVSYQYFVSAEFALCEGPVVAVGPRYWSGKSSSSNSPSTTQFQVFPGLFITLPVAPIFGTFLGTAVQASWAYLTASHPTQALAYRLTALAVGNLSLGNNAELPNYTFEVTFGIANVTAGIVDAAMPDVLADVLSNASYGIPGWSAAYNGNWAVAKAYCLAAGLYTSHVLTEQVEAAQFVTEFIESHNCMPVWSDAALSIVPLGDQALTAGAITTLTSAFAAPASSTTPPYSAAVGVVGTFAGDAGVRYTATGVPLTAKPYGTALATGQYAVEGNIYYFAAGDAGVNVTASYKQASVAAYNPPSAPIYDLDDGDFLPNQSSQGGNTTTDPVGGVRSAPRDRFNVAKIEYINRQTDYNPANISAQNDALIRLYGERADSLKQWHWFQYDPSAQAAVQLLLGRMQTSIQYAFTLPPRFVLLNPGDIVTITDVGLGLSRQWVRVRKIDENADRSLSFLVDEYLQGTGAAPLYGRQVNGGANSNYNVDPGAINAPIIFEPTDQVAQGLEVWVAVSGVDHTLYGGCDVYVSYDGVNYSFVDRTFGSARMGGLTAILPTTTVNLVGQTIDIVNTLKVDISESGGALASGTEQDALALNTACWVDGEVIAYETATLTGTGKYDLTYLVRGAGGTEDKIGAHAVGAPFVRLDSGVLRIPFTQDRIGATVSLKLVPFNVWGGGGKTIADVAPVTYTIVGTALYSPLPDVMNVVSKFVDGRLNISWDEVDDFRNGIRYEIRQGAGTPEGSLSYGTVAHPPFPVPGDGTYWVTAWCQPAAGRIVRSENWSSIIVVGAITDTNVVATFDCKAAGWPGIFLNTGIDTGLNAVRTGGAGNILSDTNILDTPDILNAGGQVSGTYRPSFVVDAGRVAPLNVTITMKGTGSPVGQDILGSPDILSMPDILGSASAEFVDVFPVIYVAQSGPGDILVEPNILADADILTFGIPFASGKKYSPGSYVGRVLGFEFDLTTFDPNTIALLLEATITVTIPARIDGSGLVGAVATALTNVTVPDTGLVIVFAAGDGSVATPFLGGNDGVLGSLPHVQVTCGASFAGDELVLSGWTTAGVTVQWNNAGVGVARDKCNISIIGF